MSLHDTFEALAKAPARRMRFVGSDGTLLTRTFAEAYDDVLSLRDELAASGLGEGDLVGIIGRNCYEWVVTDLALLALRCIPVAVPVENQQAALDLEPVLDRYHLAAALVVTPDDVATPLPDAAADVTARPLRFHPRAVGPLDPPLPADVFSISFSSGSTGTPKGLLMSRPGIENTIAMSGAAWRVRPDDDILIVAPFSTFQQRYFTYLAITWGFDLSVVAPERLFQQLRILEPTIVIGPPSFFETLENRVRAASGRTRWRYWLAVALHRVGPGRSTAGLRARLGRPWAAVYGRRVRLMLTGSAPVGASMVRVFQQLGLPLYEVYGSTEVGWISFNLPGADRIGTAGRPVDGVEVALGDGDEILARCRAPQTVGYRFEGEETAASFYLDDGWIATGDVGRFVGRGFLQLVGRRTNTLITRSGVKINPEPLEQALEAHEHVERAMVLLNDQASALRAVVWLTDPDADADVDAHVAGLNAAVDPAQRIVQLVTRPASEVTVESGLLTRNFKFDRAAAAAHVLDRAQVGS